MRTLVLVLAGLVAAAGALSFGFWRLLSIERQSVASLQVQLSELKESLSVAQSMRSIVADAISEKKDEPEPPPDYEPTHDLDVIG